TSTQWDASCRPAPVNSSPETMVGQSSAADVGAEPPDIGGGSDDAAREADSDATVTAGAFDDAARGAGGTAAARDSPPPAWGRKATILRRAISNPVRGSGARARSRRPMMAVW